MRKIELSYRLCSEREPAALIRNPLFELLLAVRASGSISGAARQLGLSYRHVWGQLKDWEQTLDQALIFWERGQAARLTPFADRLLWSERLAQARLGPQIEALRAELERTLALAFDPQALVLGLHASHDDALPLLQDHAASQAALHLDIRFRGSVEAIQALNAGDCVLAGFHVREGAGSASVTARTYQPLLQPGRHKLIGFARRQQGLMVARGNPLRLDSLARVAHWRARFVNRAPGSGTRVLLDELLQEAGLESGQIQGYLRYEPSHAAVAQAVASGSADCGLGTEAAARAQGLDFVPLASERYYLACLKSALEQPELQRLRELLTQAAWQGRIAQLPGYEPQASGQVLSLRRELPWWQLTPRAPAGKAAADAKKP